MCNVAKTDKKPNAIYKINFVTLRNTFLENPIQTK